MTGAVALCSCVCVRREGHLVRMTSPEAALRGLWCGARGVGPSLSRSSGVFKEGWQCGCQSLGGRQWG